MRVGEPNTMVRAPKARTEARVVQAERTVTSPSDMKAAIARAYTELHGKAPSAQVLDTLTAHASLETGAGRSMYNFNFGGIKGTSPEGLTARYKTHEVLEGQSTVITDGFRAYRSLDEGARDYLRVMSGKFKGALHAAESGGVRAFAHELKRAGYFTAAEGEYAAGLESRLGSAAHTPVPSGALTTAGLPTSSEVTNMTHALSGAMTRILAWEGEDE